jgi:membrane protease YdiL (CAAX protease family)
MTEALRLIGPVALALVSALGVDRIMAVRGLLPPGFRTPWRRALGAGMVALALWMGVFLSLGQIGLAQEWDLAGMSPAQLFLLHGMLLLTLAVWLLLAHGAAVALGRRDLAPQLGLRTVSPGKEILLGIGAGILTWPMLLVVVGIALLILVAAGAEELVPQQAPELVVWIAALPLVWKVAIAASAGFVEEVFFRGFLQPRVGIGISTLLFVLAHLSYDQPFMLVGITLLSFLFAALVWWRQNIWAAVVAHFLFDAVQLVFVIPWALREGGGTGLEGLARLL